jgi:High potential iron-sulfur protein
MKSNQPQRRQFLKIGASALAMIPVMVVAGRSEAATNAAMRSALKYQNKPEGDKSCSTCMQFVAPSGCKILAGDTEVSPKGYCTAWVKKA